MGFSAEQQQQQQRKKKNGGRINCDDQTSFIPFFILNFFLSTYASFSLLLLSSFPSPLIYFSFSEGRKEAL